MKIPPVGSEFFLAEGRTDGHKDRHDEADKRFSQFCKHAKKLFAKS